MGRNLFGFADEGRMGGMIYKVLNLSNIVWYFVSKGGVVSMRFGLEYIWSSPKLDSCCRTAEPEQIESDSDDTTKTEITDSLSKASANTTATLPIPHPAHAHHVLLCSSITLCFVSQREKQSLNSVGRNTHTMLSHNC